MSTRPHYMPDPADPLLTTRTAAYSLGVSLRAIQLWCNQGKLAHVVTPGGHRRIRLSHVTELQRSFVEASGLPDKAREHFQGFDEVVKKAVDDETLKIVAYLNKMADQPTAMTTRAFWCREIAGLIANRTYKDAV
jgi:excisionase family DNA binding protein